MDTPISLETAQAIAEARHEPEWLRALRNTAWQSFMEQDWPAAHDETWRQARPELFDLERYAPVHHCDPTITGAAPSVAAHSFTEASSDLLQQYLMTRVITPQGIKIAALHAAQLNGGAIIHVPRDVVVETPIQIMWDMCEEERSYFPHVLIVAEEGSQVSVIDTYTGSAQGVVCGQTEIVAGANARVTYAMQQLLGQQMTCVSHQRMLAARDARVQCVILSVGATLSRYLVEPVAQETGADLQMLGVRVMQGEQRCHIVSVQDHVASHTTSDLLIKSVMDDQAKGTYYGTIKIHPDAQHTEAYQADRSLLLGAEAKADSTPVLEIEADDVRCTHGASMGPVDQQQLIYMGTRGIPVEIAEIMLAYGFLESAIDRIDDAHVHDVLTAQLTRAIGALELIDLELV